MKEKGSAHTFVMIGLVIALVGALSFIFWQNFIKAQPNSDSKSDISQQKPVEGSVSENVDPNEGYVVLKDWGVRFKPSNQVTLYEFKKSDDSNERASYALTTQRVSELSGCSNIKDFPLVYISRSREYTDPDNYMSGFALNNNEPIDGYYYAGSGSNQYCSDSNPEIQDADRKELAEAIKKIEKAQ